MEEKLKNIMQYVVVNGNEVRRVILNYPHLVYNNFDTIKTIITVHWKSFVDEEISLLSLWQSFNVHLIRLLASKECAWLLSSFFLLFMCVLVYSTYDIKHYSFNNQNMSNETAVESENKSIPQPKSALKKVSLLQAILIYC
jgi:hypothetical protein